MRRWPSLTALMAVPLVLTAGSQERYLEESRAIVKEFATTLQSELVHALQEGGPVEAVEVCHVRAPAIAAELSARTGWEVGRTSLRVRNPDNAPDPWEQAVLRSFSRRAQQPGAQVGTLERFEVRVEEQGSSFRYMKAIPTAALCLTCHGEAIAGPIAAKLDEHYRADRARGYKVGEIRGAFTITRPLD